MIKTVFSSSFPLTVTHRMSGVIDLPHAEQGAADALRLVKQVLLECDSIDLLLDLRGAVFHDLQAHKAWSMGFVRHPDLQPHVGFVAIIGDETPTFRAEQQLLESERLRFFVDADAGRAWLAQRGTWQPA
jgi:hypothetical protein